MLRLYSSHLQDSRTSSTEAIGANQCSCSWASRCSTTTYSVRRRPVSAARDSGCVAVWPAQLKRIGGAVYPASNWGYAVMFESLPGPS